MYISKKKLDTTYSTLSEITKTLLSPIDNYVLLQNQLMKLKSMFKEISEIDLTTPTSNLDIHLPSGIAIAPFWAGMCIDDIMRTKNFICAINHAIKDKQRNNLQEPVRVLYTGPGPFATLLLPLITQFSAQELQITFLEVNPESIVYLKKTIIGLDAEAYVEEIYNEDATTFILPSKNIDILVAECLQNTLAREPQVEITHHLINQLPKDVVLIPEEICLHLTLINTKKLQEAQFDLTNTIKHNYKNTIAPVFILNKEEVYSNPNSTQNGFPILKTIVEKELTAPYNTIAITTEMTLYMDTKLSFNDSGLTLPRYIGEISDASNLIVETQYVLGSEPHLKTNIS